MALFVNLIMVEGTRQLAGSWYVGEKFKKYHPKFQEGIQPKHVESIQADGHELDFVIDNVPNLPYPKNARVVEWHGDMAKLIFQVIPKDYSQHT